MPLEHGAESRPRWALVAVAALASMVIALVAQGLLGSIWPMLLLAGAWVWLAAYRALGAALATAFTVGSLAAAVAVLIRLTPYVGASLSTVFVFLAATVALGAAALILRSGFPVSIRALRWAWVLVPIVVVIAVAIVVQRTGDGGGLAWAMHSDSVWTLMGARFIAEDGGVDALIRPNPAPLTSSAIAIVLGVGRAGVAADDLLRHDVQSMAEFWLVAAGAGGALAAAIVVVATRKTGMVSWLRAVAAIVASMMLIGGLALGEAARFGFVNGTLALCLLLAVWLAWIASSKAQATGSAVLGLLTIALLATWAPVAIVPAVMAIVRAVGDGVSRGRVLPRPAVLPAATAVVAYAMSVTVPDLLRDGGALAADGGLLPLLARVVLMVMAGAVLLAWFARDRTWLLGTVILVLAGGLAITVLVAQRLVAGNGPWGYYPVKLSWLLLIVLAVVGFAGVLRGVAVRIRDRPVIQAAAAIAAAVIVTIAVSGVDRIDVPSAWLVTGGGVNSPEAGAALVFELSDPSTRSMVARFLDVADENDIDATLFAQTADQFVNQWLFSQTADLGDAPIRYLAYQLNPSDLEGVCSAAAVWGGDVVVLTADESASEELAECSSIREVVVERPDTGT